jgi:hypothetical protein
MITRLLEAKPELFRVLVNEEDEDQIFAWVCGDKRVTHFVFVKREFRGEGLARRLIVSPLYWRFTHWTKDCEGLVRASPGRIFYNPSLFRELINGIDQAVGRSSAQDDKHSRQDGSDFEGGRDRQAVSNAVGMVS